MTYNTELFDNGLRLIHQPSSSEVVYCGYAIKAGSRDEALGDEGLAHFCEHASFKGTEHRRASQVIQMLENLGGELNAYTNKDTTVYYCAIISRHLQRAVDLLTDMVFHSVFPQQELEREKEVICDEIESYNDSPAELIYDDFENLVFTGHPLGHNILGTAERVRQFTSADAHRFTQQHYRPDNAIFFASGNCDFSRLVRMLQKANSTKVSSCKEAPATKETLATKDVHAKKDTSSEIETNSPTPNEIVIRRETHQAHVMIGCRAYDINSPRRIALYLLNNIIAGPAMSSLLNMSLRERHGLVYTVESTMQSYQDTGVWTVYFGCDKHDVKRCQRLIRRTLDNLMQKPLSQKRLTTAKRQLKGQIALACDSRESFALDFAKSFLLYGWEKDVTALCNNIDKLTADDLQTVARELFAPDHLTTLIYNPE